MLFICYLYCLHRLLDIIPVIATKVSTPNYTLISFTKRYILIVVAKLFLDIRQTSLMSLLAKQLFKTGLATFKQNHLVTCVKSKVVPGNHC